MRNFLIILVCMVMCWMTAGAETITVTYHENGSAVIGGKDVEGVKITVKGNVVKIKDLRDYEKNLNTLTYVLKGKTSDGQFVLNTYVKAKVRMEGLDLTSQEGAPIHLKNKKTVELEAAKGTANRIVIAACNDTARNKQAAIWAKDKLTLTGKGTLQVEALGNGCKGINCKDDLKISDLTLNVVTKGDNLGVDTTKTMGPPMGAFNPEDIPEEVKKKFEEMRQKFEENMKDGKMPFGFKPDSLHGPGGMPMPPTRAVLSPRKTSAKSSPIPPHASLLVAVILTRCG